MASPDLRHVEALTDRLIESVGGLQERLGRSGVRELAVRLANGERVTVRKAQPVSYLMRRYRVSRSAAYRLLDKHADQDDDGHWFLTEDSEGAIHEEIAVRGVRRLLIRLLMEGRLIVGVGPKSEPAARRWLQRHWRPESERLTVVPPGEPLDLRDARRLEEWGRDVMPKVMPR